MDIAKLVVTILLAIMIIVEICESFFTIREILDHKKEIVDGKDSIEDTEHKGCKEELKCMFEEKEYHTSATCSCNSESEDKSK